MGIFRGYNNYYQYDEVSAEDRHMNWRWGVVYLVCVGTSVLFCLSAVS